MEGHAKPGRAAEVASSSVSTPQSGGRERGQSVLWDGELVEENGRVASSAQHDDASSNMEDSSPRRERGDSVLWEQWNEGGGAGGLTLALERDLLAVRALRR